MGSEERLKFKSTEQKARESEPSKYACGRRQEKHSFLLMVTLQLSKVYKQIFSFISCQLKSFANIIYKMALPGIYHELHCVKYTNSSMDNKTIACVFSSY